jgi:hypothetical protein
VVRGARRAGVVAALLFPFAAQARQGLPGDSASVERIAVGIACSDGTFTPLARRDGAWQPLVGEPKVDSGSFFAALTPEALRLPREGWTLYAESTGTPEPLSLGAPGRASIDSSSACGDMQAQVAAGVRQARPKSAGTVTGYGILGAARFDLLEDVTGQPDDDSRGVAQRIVQEVHAAERRLARRTLRGGSRSHLAQFSGRPNVRSTVRLFELKRDRQLDGDWYFFQARKQYGERYTVDGTRTYRTWASVLVHGWVRASGVVTAVDVVASLENGAEGNTAESYSIAGVIRANDGDIWLARVSRRQATYYRLFDVGPGAAPPRRVLEVMTQRPTYPQ